MGGNGGKRKEIKCGILKYYYLGYGFMYLFVLYGI